MLIYNFEGVQVVQRGAPADGGDLGGAGGQPAGVPPVHRQRPRHPPHEVRPAPPMSGQRASCCPLSFNTTLMQSRINTNEWYSIYIILSVRYS